MSETGLPMLPTMGVGPYAVPGWFIAMPPDLKSGRFGPHDIDEAVNDAVRVIVADQVDAGLDILSDGEVRRQRFVYEMYQHLTGLERIPATRRLGISGYDQAPRFRATGPLAAPGGLHLVEEFRFLSAIAGGRPVKMAVPGPLTFAMSIVADTRRPADIMADISAILATELAALSDAGCDRIQLDEPALPHPPFGLTPAHAAAPTADIFSGMSGYRGLHVCFGNNAGRPFADRRMGRLREAMAATGADQLVLEFANREMAEVDILRDLASDFDIAAGVVDVKNYLVEGPDDVARRIDQVLAHVPAERLTTTADCGFSALPRYIARQKMDALVAGTRLVRGR